MNISTTTEYLLSMEEDILLLCAGWKGTVNMEDTLYAGALCDKLKLEVANDSTQLAKAFYRYHKSDLVSVAFKSSHAKRLSSFGVEKDLVYCMTADSSNQLVVEKEGLLTRI